LKPRALARGVFIFNYRWSSYLYFEGEEKMSNPNKLKDALEEGIKGSKLTSHKQGILRGAIHGLIIGVSLFNPFKIYMLP